ncbi:Uncharacterised protein [Mycobacteroides abscessus subsp. abscessus]|nr:Uncharacterised protein [Mycobacteroides abscessus subsp. abscessus]
MRARKPVSTGSGFLVRSATATVPDHSRASSSALEVGARVASSVTAVPLGAAASFFSAVRTALRLIR